MKTLSPLVFVAIAALFTCPNDAFAKKQKPTFSDFKGSYTGTLALVASGSTYTGPVSVGFGTNKTGKSATITISGSFVAGGTTLPVNGTIGLANGAFSVDSVILHTFGSTPAPGAGSYTRTNRVISFQGAYTTDPSYTVVGSIATATKGHKQTLTFTFVLSQNGTPAYAFTFNISRHSKGK